MFSKELYEKCQLSILFTILICLFCSAAGDAKKPDRRPNILFIAVDDLRPELGCYGNKAIISPNIDKLASEGLVFNRAYCQQAICMASRASLMSGLRPDTNRIYNCESLKKLAPDTVTINQHFADNGYQIWSSGKIYHHSEDTRLQFGDCNVEPDVKTVGRGYLDPESIRIVKDYESQYRQMGKGDAAGRGPAYESPDVPDNAYSDGAMTDLAIKQLDTFKNSDQPFFMAVGYHKPHLPFNAPKKYWDMYDGDAIAMADNPFMPKNISEYFNNNFGELRNYAGIPKGKEPISQSLAKNLKHGYYACVSYMDAQVGRLMNALSETGLDKNTIIILWGDHGWKLGDHGLWCKHTNFEVDTHAPLLVKVPGGKMPSGKTDALVEFVDIYPTLCDLAGLEKPSHLQGSSFVPVIEKPNRPFKQGVISMWPYSDRNDPDKVILGFALKTDRYRYIEWYHLKTGQLLARDLFDHKTDPNENINISKDPGNKALMDELSRLLDRGHGWKAIAEQLQP